jgi:hypothetical protein
MNVLPQDRELTEKLWECGCIYLNHARAAWVSAHFDQAERWAEEFFRCKRDLDELIKRKEEHDKLLQVVEMMKERGVDIAVILRKGNEQ